jgi:hypothetical protein
MRKVRKWPQLREAGAEVDREEHADIGIALMWVRNQPNPIKFGFRVLVLVCRYCGCVTHMGFFNTHVGGLFDQLAGQARSILSTTPNPAAGMTLARPCFQRRRR